MPIHRLNTKETALSVTFTALYVVFGFLKISPIIGLSGQAITAAAIIAPIMGILLGPYISTLSTFLGGIIGFSLGSFSPSSLASGIFAALAAGATHTSKRAISISIYLSLLLLLAFFPSIGAAWLFPLVMWFQILGLIILISPLQSIATVYLNATDNSKLLYGLFVTSLTSTLVGQIAGTLTLEALIFDVSSWKTTWVTITPLYPAERTIIALAATLVGASLLKALRHTNMVPNSHFERKNGQD